MGSFSRRELVLALGAALLLRLFMLWLVTHENPPSDGTIYERIALNVLDHGTFSIDQGEPIRPSLYRPPGYPLFMASVYAVFGRRLVPLQLAQAALGLLAILLLAKTVSRLWPDAARPALWLAALSPFDAVYAGQQLSEALAGLLLVCAMSSAVLLRGAWRWLALGASLAAATLTRDVYLALIPFTAMFLLLPYPAGVSLGARFVRAGLVVAAAALVIAPWTARNYSASGEIVLTSKGILGHGLWIGSWETNGAWMARGGLAAGVPPESWSTEEERREVEAAFQHERSSAARDQALKEIAVSRMKNHPFRVLAVWARRAPKLWFGTRFDTVSFRPAFLAYGAPAWTALKVILFGINAVLILGGLAGIALAFLRRSPLLWLLIPVLYNFLIFVPLHGTEPRYSQPVLVFLTAFLGAALSVAMGRIARLSTGDPAPERRAAA